MKINWIETEKELPPQDGIYEITNHPEKEDDLLRREMTSTAFYDGYGFNFLGVYRQAKFWRKFEYVEKRYGKIK